MGRESRRVYVAAGSMHAAVGIVRARGLTNAVFVRSRQQLLGQRGCLLIIHATYDRDDWADLAAYAKCHGMDVDVE